ncbi:MAG: YlmC/YmxH family sporulation protein [Halanaerobium sp.]|nr:YlmC/YmxH family sporulation protein [Halanaerobium sp.]
MIKTSELRMKEVINILDGRKLGFVEDIELDLEKGRIKSVVVPGKGSGVLRLFSKNQVLIPWEKIVKIGVDVVLVELPGFTENNYNHLPVQE